MPASLLASNERAHAKLSASSAYRWLHCPPSVKLSEQFPDTTSEYAEEGTLAHELCAYFLAKELKKPLPELSKDLDSYPLDMVEYAKGYALKVQEFVTEGATVCIEQKVDFSNAIGVENSFGTADCLIVNDGTAHVIDFKYGMGVQVKADHNPQMMLYALGALYEFGFLYDISNFKLTIIQPRLSKGLSTWEITTKELNQTAKEQFAPKAQEANKGEGDFSCGDWCRFCKAKTTCLHRAHEMLSIEHSMQDSSVLSDSDIENILSVADEVIAWLKSIKDMALQSAINGKQWHGFELRAGRAVRKYTDENKVAEVLQAQGIEPYEPVVPKLKTITALEKEIGKKKFNELVGELTQKVEGSQKLVPVTK